MAAKGFRQASHQGRACRGKKGRECLGEPKSFCNVCAPREWTWCSVTLAAQSCPCMTRLKAAAFAIFLRVMSRVRCSLPRDMLGQRDKLAWPSPPAVQVQQIL